MIVSENDPPLHQLAFRGDDHLLGKLLEDEKYRMEIDVRNRLGCTPLRLASSSGSDSCVRLLLANGADVETTDMKGQTALFVAVKNGYFEVAKSLLGLGNANPDGSDKALCTPLYYAAMEDRADIVELLLEHGASVNPIKTLYGHNATPLRIAITYNHFRCAELLLRGGADPNLSPVTSVFGRPASNVNVGESAFHLIVRHGSDARFIPLLLQFGANPFMKNSRQLYAWEGSTGKTSENKAILLELIKKPLSLQSLCRISLWNLCREASKGQSFLHDRKLLEVIQQFNLPPKVLNFLLFRFD